jgi:hypothetical protein
MPSPYCVGTAYVLSRFLYEAALYMRPTVYEAAL